MKRALLWGIQFYRSAISPYKGGPRCRYTPTCSQYAQTAIERYGAVKGCAAGGMARPALQSVLQRRL